MEAGLGTNETNDWSSAAVGVAAVLSEKFQALPAQDLKNVGVILCGGNVDLDNLPWKK